MTRLPLALSAAVAPSPTRARAIKARDLQRAGMTTDAIAAQMMRELPRDTKLRITADDVRRLCEGPLPRAPWSGAH